MDGKSLKDFLSHELDQLVPASADTKELYGITLLPHEKGKITFGQLMMKQLMTQACSGHSPSLKEALDRMLGKSTQVTKSLNVSATYEDFLDMLADEEDKAALDNSTDDMLDGLTFDMPPPKPTPEKEITLEDLL